MKEFLESNLISYLVFITNFCVLLLIFDPRIYSPSNIFQRNSSVLAAHEDDQKCLLMLEQKEMCKFTDRNTLQLK
jgi:hypothetical protein